MVRILAFLVFLLLPATAFAQGQQCRTSPVGASTAYCGSEAFVTESVASAVAGSVTGPASSTPNDLPAFSDASGKVLKDSGIPAVNTTNASNISSGTLASGRYLAAWASYTPTVACTSGAPTYTITEAAFVQFNKTVHLEVKFNVSATNTCTGFVNVSLPVTPNRGAIGSGFSGTTGKMLTLVAGSGSALGFVSNYDGTTTVGTNGNFTLSLTLEST